MSRLTIIEGPGTGRVVARSSGGAVVGRQEGLDVTLDSPSVSRRHARVTWEGDDVFIEDLGSVNGTYVNGPRIQGRTLLRVGNTVRIGESVFRLEPEQRTDPDITIQRQTVAATSNAELFRDHSGVKLQAVLELAHHLGRSADTGAVVARVLDHLLILFPNSDRALVLTREGDEARVLALKHRSGSSSGGPAFSRSVLRKVFAQGVAVLAEDTSQDPGLLASTTFNAVGIRSLLCVPLQTQAGRVVGALQLDRFAVGRPFTQEDLYLMTAVSLMVSAVLENAQLQQEIRLQEARERQLAEERALREASEKARAEIESRNVRLAEAILAARAAQAAADEARRQAEAANAAKNEFLGIAAHDLRNPLNAVRGYAEMILEDGALGDENAALLRNIHEAAAHMASMVQNLLDANRIDCGDLRIDRRAILLRPILLSVVEAHLRPAAAKGQSIHLEGGEDALAALGDAMAVTQVLENLVSNAVKYSPPGLQIFVRSRMTAGGVRIEVQDQGPGLTDDDKKRLFGRFARLSAAPTGGEKSVGLGLSIVKRMVEAMNGRVWCDSEPGRGATFVVELPVPDA